MPCNYTHYRMGAQALSGLPGDVRRSIQRFRRLYNAGLQGPDLLFYYNPFLKNAIGRLGSTFHRQTGKDFFSRVCRQFRSDPTEAGMVYIYGLLAHYCLDSIAHPYVESVTGSGKPGHIELEVEFDRFLLELDGKTPAHQQYLGKNVKLTWGECETVSHFLQPATPGNVRRSVTVMKLCMWLLTAPALRKPVAAVVRHLSATVREQLMTIGPNPSCARLDDSMVDLLSKALERYPEMLRQLREHIQNGTPLGEDFELTFG